MAAMQVQDTVFNNVDDDDGMPPLVDAPCPSMTFTFATDMTPITYSTDPTCYEVTPEQGTEQSFMYSPPIEPDTGATRNSHAKKRDASYIPRPPNAFILFRSSFIKAQHIPGKIEGNHSALSKIIGKYWKALPREEREVWEAKAIVAQAEHRKKYPDWRFRPAANALAKVKDGPKRRNSKKGRGEAEKEERSREKRCAKIADLLVAGKKGTDLEAAIEEYDYENGEKKKVKTEGCGVFVMRLEGNSGVLGGGESMKPPVETGQTPPSQNTSPQIDEKSDIRFLTLDSSCSVRFKTPLTSMFKRSSSAPASYIRNSASSAAFMSSPTLARRDSFSSVSTSDSPLINPSAPCIAFSASLPRVSCDITTMSNPVTRMKDAGRLSLFPHSSFGSVDPTDCTQYCGGADQQAWSDILSSSRFDADRYNPTLPEFVPDVDDATTPAQSPVSYAFELNAEGDCVGSPPLIDDTISGKMDSNVADYVHSHSSYSSLKGWAGDAFSKTGCNPFSQTFMTTPSSPLVYDPDNIMKDAFAAAASAPFDQWGIPFDSVHMSYRLTNAGDMESLQHYAQGWQSMAYPQDNRYQLF